MIYVALATEGWARLVGWHTAHSVPGRNPPAMPASPPLPAAHPQRFPPVVVLAEPTDAQQLDGRLLQGRGGEGRHMGRQGMHRGAQRQLASQGARREWDQVAPKKRGK